MKKTHPVKPLRMQKVGPAQLGFRADLVAMLSGSPDPFVAELYNLDIGPCMEYTKEQSAEAGIPISLSSVINKLIAAAVSENPEYNQLVLGGSVYQLADISIANAFLLPGRDQALTYGVLDNAHTKPLVQVQRELLALMEEKKRLYAERKNALGAFLLRLYFKTRLYRLVPEKIAFRAGYRKGLVSNIVLSNHVYSGPGNYTVLKPAVTPMNISLRIHTAGASPQPAAHEGIVVIKNMMPVTVITDHRIVHGVHAHMFGESLKRIAADPKRCFASLEVRDGS